MRYKSGATFKKELSISFNSNDSTVTSTYTATADGYVIFQEQFSNASTSGYNAQININSITIYRDQNTFMNKSNCYFEQTFLINNGDIISIQARYNLANNSIKARIYEY